jgi:hypothetical protein
VADVVILRAGDFKKCLCRTWLHYTQPLVMSSKISWSWDRAPLRGVPDLPGLVCLHDTHTEVLWVPGKYLALPSLDNSTSGSFPPKVSCHSL